MAGKYQSAYSELREKKGPEEHLSFNEGNTDWMPISEAASRTGMSKQMIRLYYLNGDIRGMYPPWGERPILINLKELKKFIEKKKSELCSNNN